MKPFQHILYRRLITHITKSRSALSSNSYLVFLKTFQNRRSKKDGVVACQISWRHTSQIFVRIPNKRRNFLGETMRISSIQRIESPLTHQIIRVSQMMDIILISPKTVHKQYST